MYCEDDAGMRDAGVKSVAKGDVRHRDTVTARREENRGVYTHSDRRFLIFSIYVATT